MMIFMRVIWWSLSVFDSDCIRDNVFESEGIIENIPSHPDLNDSHCWIGRTIFVGGVLNIFFLFFFQLVSLADLDNAGALTVIFWKERSLNFI